MQRSSIKQLLGVLLFSFGLVLHGCGGGGDGSRGGDATITTTPAALPNPALTCLCVFDIDSTLTGWPGKAANCPNTLRFDGIKDVGHRLVVSEGLLKLNQTFCHDCYIGIVSAGNAMGKGSDMRQKIVELLQRGGHLPVGGCEAWNPRGHAPLQGPLVTSYSEGQKQHAIPGIQKFYADKFNASIEDEQVYFFDDRQVNIHPFKAYQSKHKYNARMISCEPRIYHSGMCGATLAELKHPQTGVTTCNPPQEEHQEEVVV